MNETLQAPRAARAIAVIAVAAAALLAPEVAAEAASHGHHVAKRHHAKHKRHKRRRQTHSKAAKAKSMPAAPAPSSTPTTCTSSPGLAAGTVDPFEQHFDAAHLERSPAEQVQDAGDVSTYVRVHTALVEAMAQPSLSAGDEATAVLQKALAPFLAHVYAAHLEQSPSQQAAALMDPSTYTLSHTVLLEQMLKPVLDWVQELLAGKQTCSSATQQPSSGAASSAKAIDISGHMFMPQELSVPQGTSVTWTNDDADPHNVVADGGAFKSKSLGKGESFSYTFSSPGTYAYSCSIHPDMRGKVSVG